ncbi:MAG TPA: ATP-binding cassette domain-containing protein [Microbacteriaceae bacterium]|nr:ATP-binding cassette domain-containing protein [Microbacteriaceae bacterium]
MAELERATPNAGVGLEVRGLRAGYDGSEVLHGLDLTVAPGEIVAVLGRNGMGKSTLVNTLSGSIAPIAGSIHLDGVDVTTAAPSARFRRGLRTFRQERPVFPELTVAQNLSMVGVKSMAKPSSYFEFLAKRGGQAAGTLSGGEQKMLAMARMASGGGSMWILDEPTEGLQPSNVERSGAIVLEAAERGCGVLLVEQHLNIALKVASRWYLMENGLLVESGDVGPDTRRYIFGRISV